MKIDAEYLNSEAGDLLKRWNCESDGEPFCTHSSFLWPVKRSGIPLMLKIAYPGDDEAHAADILKFFDGEGVVKLIESEGTAQLLERIQVQEKSLEHLVLNGEDDLATQIICDVIAKLHSSTAGKENPPNLIPFQARTEQMGRHLAEGRVKVSDLPLFEAAILVYDELVQETAASFRPLHGDIHHFNILCSNSRGWLAIDPKGIFGPRAYEYANSLCNPYQHLEIVTEEARMNRQASLIAEFSGVEKITLLKFAFLHGAQGAAWSLYELDQAYWIACARTAAALVGIRLKN